MGCLFFLVALSAPSAPGAECLIWNTILSLKQSLPSLPSLWIKYWALLANCLRLLRKKQTTFPLMGTWHTRNEQPDNGGPTVLFITDQWCFLGKILIQREKVYTLVNKWSHFKMELVLPFQRNCLACLIAQTFGILKRRNNLWPKPRATLCPKEMFAKVPRKQILWLLDWWLQNWNLKTFKITVTMLSASTETPSFCWCNHFSSPFL